MAIEELAIAAAEAALASDSTVTDSAVVDSAAADSTVIDSAAIDDAATDGVAVNKGVAPIRPEYLVQRDERSAPAAGAAGGDKRSGQNKGRNAKNRNTALFDARKDKLCLKLSMGEECAFGDGCSFSHDVAGYLARKEPDIGTTCPVFDGFGMCSFGLRCRFAGSHTTDDHKQIVDEDKVKAVDQKSTINNISKATQIRLRKKQVPFPLTDEFDKSWMQAQDSGDSTAMRCATDEKKQARRKPVEYSGKTYLAPLTTVGNLPFRRVCKEFGVGITCSEMAIANNIVQGSQTELALLKRHKSETIFGVQLAGSRADVIGRATEFVCNECDVDFIDLNMGCPIEMAFNNGGGSALLAQPRRIERILRTMRHVANCDVTVKFRTGVKNTVNLAHQLVPQFESWGAAMGTLHGRSRQQRYTKHADWDYIGRCKQAATQMPLFGGGDVLSWEDYWEHMETQKQCDGIMVGRGALIKPWIFREIDERRVWDISATERLDILKQFANFGMEHWGTDNQGIANVRRYLLEWQSFLHRYIPAGILEVLPQKINDRPPPFVGRNDLETLMASPLVGDWIKISEMLLGPAPDGFAFVPKHKSNSYEG